MPRSLRPIRAAKATDFSATIDWGDGTSSAGSVADDPASGFDVFGSHTYAQGGDYRPVVTVGTSVASGGASISAVTSEVDVDFLPLSVADDPISTTAGLAFSGAIASFSSGDAELVAADFAARIDWGDGSAAGAGQVVADADGSFSVTGAHIYNTAGTYTVAVAIGRASADAPTTAVKLDASVASPPPAPPAPPVVTAPAPPVATVPAAPVVTVPTPPVTTAPVSPSAPVATSPAPSASPVVSGPPAPVVVVVPAPSAVVDAERNGSVQIVVTNLGAMAGVQASNASSYRITIAGRLHSKAVKIARVIGGAGGSSVTIVPRGTFARGTVFSIMIGGKESVTATFAPVAKKVKAPVVRKAKKG